MKQLSFLVQHLQLSTVLASALRRQLKQLGKSLSDLLVGAVIEEVDNGLKDLDYCLKSQSSLLEFLLLELLRSLVGENVSDVAEDDDDIGFLVGLTILAGYFAGPLRECLEVGLQLPERIFREGLALDVKSSCVVL